MSKLWNLSRAFRSPQMVFPGTGGFTGPAQLLDIVVFTEEMNRLSVMQNVRFGFDIQNSATGGVTTSLNHPEPGAGFFHVPLLWLVAYDGVANIAIDAAFVATASALDPWGRYSSTTQLFSNVRAVAGRPANVPVIPYMRGHNLRATFNNPAAASSVSSNLWFLECPAECCTLEMWRGLQGNYTGQVALP